VAEASAGERDTLRCFVGAFLLPADARRLRRAAAAVSGSSGRLLPEASHHVTLKFLGDVPRPRLAAVRDQVAALAGHPVAAELPALTGFPQPRAARMLVAEVAGADVLYRWQAALEEAFDPEDRDFRPHVTVLRWKRSRRFGGVSLTPPLKVTLLTPMLYRSDTDRHGARYRPVTEQDFPSDDRAGAPNP